MWRNDIKSWQNYLSLFIENIRGTYETELQSRGFDTKILSSVDYPFQMVTFPKPCQIRVLDFSPVDNGIFWIVTFDKSKPDKHFEVFEEVKGSVEEFVETHKQYREYISLMQYIKIAQYREPPSILPEIFFHEKNMTMIFGSDLRAKIESRPLALRMYEDHRIYVLGSIQRSTIKKSASEILSKAREISETDRSPSLLKAIESIEDSVDKLKKIEEHELKLASIEDRLVGVRKLVGTKTFGEWKVLLSEVDKINTRIDALSDIKKAYDTLFTQQNQFMKQQSEVMKQQSSLLNWVKYSMILVPIVVACVPIIEALIRHFLGSP